MSRNGKILDDDKRVTVDGGDRLNPRLYEMEIPSPTNIVSPITVYRKYLTLNNDGITTSMKVDGSSTPQEFYIGSEEGYDIYIGALCFFLSATNTTAELSDFGAALPLTNGCNLIYGGGDLGGIQFSENIKTNFDFMRLTGFVPAFGNYSGTVNRPFMINNVYSSADSGYMPIIRYSSYGYEPEYRGGLRLLSGTQERLILQVNDNLSALISNDLEVFNCIAYGFRIRIPS